MFTLEEIKSYCRVNEDDNDLITVFLPAAKAYVDNALERELVDDSRYRLLILMLINHWYTNKDIATEVKFSDMPLTWRVLMQQLQNEV